MVQKEFASVPAAEREAAVYRRLAGTGLKTAALLGREDRCLKLSFLDGEDYVALLERQEAKGFSTAPWAALLNWLMAFYRATGLVQQDLNLHNFLWLNGETAGLDFEDCCPGSPAEMLARLSAFVLNYDPAYTETKKRVAAFIRQGAIQAGLCSEHAYPALLAREEELLLQRRRRRCL